MNHINLSFCQVCLLEIRAAHQELPKSHSGSLLKTGIISVAVMSSDSKDFSERLNTAGHYSAISYLNSLRWTLGLSTRQLWRFPGTHSLGTKLILLKSEQNQCWILLQKGFQCFPDVSLTPNPSICPSTVPELINTNLPVGTQRSTSSLDRFKPCWIFFCLVILLERHKD